LSEVKNTGDHEELEIMGERINTYRILVEKSLEKWLHVA
jgi:hypothetical protein